MMPSIYIAATYERRLEMQEYRDELLALGYSVTSRWLEGTHDKEPWEICALHDYHDVQDAYYVVTFTAPAGTYSRGGRHVEVGLAIAWDKQVLLVGQRENVFHSLPHVTQCDTWNDCLRALEELHNEDSQLRLGDD